MQRRDPGLSGARLTEEVERYWSAPSADENSPAPHATGAAVDLTLKWKDGETLWMGSLFDDVTQLAAATGSNPWRRTIFLFPTRKHAPTAACCIG